MYRSELIVSSVGLIARLRKQVRAQYHSSKKRTTACCTSREVGGVAGNELVFSKVGVP